MKTKRAGIRLQTNLVCFGNDDGHLSSDLGTRVTRLNLHWPLLRDSQIMLVVERVAATSPQEVEQIALISILSMMLPVICQTGLSLSAKNDLSKKTLAERVVMCARMVIEKCRAGALGFILQNRNS